VVGFGRFLANPKVSIERLIDGWGADAGRACEGRHVLAIQDLSEIVFKTRPEDRRGLGEVGRSGRGVLLHAMVGVDAEDGSVLGLVSGRVWTRAGRVSIAHDKRALADKESERWLACAQAAKVVLAKAACVTVVADRESDIYEEWAMIPQPGVQLLTRAMHDRRTDRGTLSSAKLAPAGEAQVTLRAQPGRAKRQARLVVRYGRVRIQRPAHGGLRHLPEHVELSLVEVTEADPPVGVPPIAWRLLTTHPIADKAAAWRIVGWYRQRWTIEQLFRTMKQQGLQLEDSQLDTAERLIKLTAIAARAACAIMQLVQAREGRSSQLADLVFSPAEIDALHALAPTLEGETAAQKNPHPPPSLAWAAWIIAKLGGWDGYPSSRPPGPITFKHGLDYFRAFAEGRTSRNV
jgi:hypothetical protein